MVSTGKQVRLGYKEMETGREEIISLGFRNMMMMCSSRKRGPRMEPRIPALKG